MICNLTIDSTVIELAGGDGRQSETSGLRIDTETNFERVAYLGVTDGRQFARPGSYVSVSFSSIQTFSTVTDAEEYILELPADLADQSGATVQIGRSNPAILIAGTLTIDGSTPATSGASYLTGTANGKPSYTGDKWDIKWTTDFPTIGQNA